MTRYRKIDINKEDFMDFALWLAENRSNCAVEFAMQTPNKFTKFCKEKFYDKLKESD